MSSPDGTLTPEQKYQAAVVLLQGTNSNFILCWLSTLASVLATVLGIKLMTVQEDNDAGLGNRVAFSIQSVVFLFAQSFTLAKTGRDYHLSTFDLASKVAKPTPSYMVQVAVFFVVAFGCAVYSLVVMSVAADTKAFFAMIIVWIMLSSLCLSKTIRDRHEAAACRGLPLQESRLQHIMTLCLGTMEYRLLVWLGAVSSVLLMLGTMWSWDNSILVVERKGYFTGMVLFSLVSSFHLAKLVRDRADPVKAKALQNQLPYQALIILSSIMSSGSLVAGACLMPLQAEHRLFVLTGSCFSTTSALFLAKHVRDRQEAEILCAPPIAVGRVVLGAATGVAPETAPPATAGEAPTREHEDA